jgi:hypothetical protein
MKKLPTFNSNRHKRQSEHLNKIKACAGGSSSESLDLLKVNKRWSEKIDHQEEILFDALDHSFETPRRKDSEISMKPQVTGCKTSTVKDYKKSKFVDLGAIFGDVGKNKPKRNELNINKAREGFEAKKYITSIDVFLSKNSPSKTSSFANYSG